MTKNTNKTAYVYIPQIYFNFIHAFLNINSPTIIIDFWMNRSTITAYKDNYKKANFIADI